jgi:hypothetical protein
MVFKEVIALYSEKDAELMNTKCRESGGTYIYQ